MKAGDRFGRLIVIGRHGTRGTSSVWTVRCDCGTVKNVLKQQLSNTRERSTKSCGCLAKELIKARRTVHGACVGGISSPEYQAWCSMRSRCRPLTDGGHIHYGGRGIRVCERWLHSFQNFLADMGPRPSSKHSIERIDVNGHYENGNCKWGTPKEQSRNTRHSKKHMLNGRLTSLAEICEETGFSKSAMALRIKRHGLHTATTTPKHLSPTKRKFGKHNVLYKYNGASVCVNQLAKMAGVAHCVMRRRLKKMPPEQAVEMPRLRPTNKGRLGRGRQGYS